LEGLEISEILLSDLYSPIRIDAETYRPFYMEIENAVLENAYTTLGEISKIFKKGIFDIKSSVYSDSGIPFVRISNLKQMGISTNDIIFIPKEENDKNLNTYLSKGDIILSKTAYPSASIVQLENCNTSQDTVAIKLKKNCGIDSAYLVAFLNSKYGFFQMQRWFTGNVQMHLNLTDGKGIFIPKLSTDFQERISAEFWESFRLKDKYQEKYRQAEHILLKAIGLSDFEPNQNPVNIKSFSDSFGCSGRLDAEYYQVKYDDLEEAIRQNSDYFIIGNIRTDNFRGLQPEYFENGELDVINSKHILENTLDYGNFEKTSGSFWESKKRARVFKGDILTYTTGANIGRTQVYLIEDKALASNHVNILRLKEGYNPIYVGFVLNSLIGRMQTEKFSAGSAQAELYPKDIDQFIIPFCSDENQTMIMEQIEESFKLKKQSEHLGSR